MRKDIAKMISKNVQHVREMMGISLMDMQWITGSMVRKWKVDDATEISDPSFAILIRYLYRYPQENPLPKVPEINEIENMLEMYWDEVTDLKFCTKRIGPLFGCSPLAGYKWKKDAIPSQAIRHIMLILSNAIKKDGRAGLRKFIEVVKEEAMSRGIESSEMWKEGWKPYNRRKEAAEGIEKVIHGRIPKMTSKNVQHVREKMGISLMDMQWITGSMARKWKVDDVKEIADPSFAILIRYLDKYPEENPLPKTPEIYEIENMLEMYWDEVTDLKFCTKRIGPLFGCSWLAGYKWKKDAIPSQAIRHIMLILSNAIKKDGKVGLRKFIEVVKEEAMSRGIETSEMWIDGWKPYNRRREANKKAANKKAA